MDFVAPGIWLAVRSVSVREVASLGRWLLEARSRHAQWREDTERGCVLIGLAGDVNYQLLEHHGPTTGVSISITAKGTNDLDRAVVGGFLTGENLVERR
jgi:hypothetical protein